MTGIEKCDAVASPLNFLRLIQSEPHVFSFFIQRGAACFFLFSFKGEQHVKVVVG
jgi:hypothetical protein